VRRGRKGEKYFVSEVKGKKKACYIYKRVVM